MRIVILLLFLLTSGCSNRSVQSLAKSNTRQLIKKIDRQKSEKRFSEIYGQERIATLKDFLHRFCTGRKRTKFLNFSHAISEDNQRLLQVEFKYCKTGWALFSYTVEDEKLKLWGFHTAYMKDREQNLLKRKSEKGE